MIMQTTTSNDIVLEKIYNAPVTLVWQAITEEKHMRKWYFDFKNQFQLEVGKTFDWYAGDLNDKQWLHRGEMLEIVPYKKLVHSWAYPGYSGKAIAHWELSEVDANKTKLHFRFEFAEPFDTAEPALARNNFVNGWNEIILNSLEQYLAKQTK
jgi:uncharacterized protein YndB with AHSA1/START domain